MTVELPADALIVRRLREGDEAVFGSLMVSWSPLMLRLARHHVSTVQAAEDLVQDTWLSVLCGLHRFEGRSSLQTWVFRILVNKAKSCGVREHRTMPWTVAFAGGSAGLLDTCDQWPDGWRMVPQRRPVTPESELLSREVRRLLAEAVGRLPARQRAVLELRDVCGYTAEEACRLLGISKTNQRVLLHRARAVVRACVEEYLSPPAA